MRSFPEAFKVRRSFIYGRADDVKRIIDLLSLEDGSDYNSTVISIIADRGTGRTTLLNLLYSELGNTFDTIKFVCMPEKIDEKGLMRLIIESLTEIPCDITDTKLLEEIVKEEIKDKRILFLLDNFENKNQNCWDLLVALLKVCKDKSAIVVTTTREAIANVKGAMQFYYMNNLSNKWCWTIFEEAVFFGENQNTVSALADVGKLLVAKCRNVTLCIKVLSGLLRRSITDKWWRDVLDNKFWEMDGVNEDTPPALRVCYEYLPSYLKQCFKYCSLFPKEYIFSKEYLVRLWLSQGFIEPADGRELEDIGAEYFDHFLSLSFFQPSLFPGQTEDRFVMAGLIHDLALCLSENECFQFEGCVQRAPENACHLSLVPHEFQSVSLSQIITRTKHLQTLSVASRSAFHNQSISSSIINLVDLKGVIGKFHNLITLNLNYTDIEELPKTFGSLTKLRYLSLSSTKIKKIPLEISNLIQLQTLEAKDCDYLEELPRSIEALTNLRYLDVTREAGYVVMLRGIENLTNLRNLATFNVGKDALVHCGIDELKDMQHLKGCLQILGLVNVKSGSDAIKAHIRSKEHIETLCFNWNDGVSFLEGEGTEIAAEVLESLRPTDNLKEVIIRDYPGNSFPKWIECVAFTRLVSVMFDHCYNCESLPALGGLPSLRFLSIQKLYSVERMNLSGSEYISENIVRYPSLEQLTIWEMYELVEWIEVGNGNFPVLHSLCINKCPFLRNVPNFPSLVELMVYSCAQFLESMDLPSLQSLRIEGLHNTKSARLPENLVALKKLEISHCPILSSIEGFSTLLNSLEKIIIFRCPLLDAQVDLDENLFTRTEKGHTGVWLQNKKIDSSHERKNFVNSGLRDEQRGHPMLLTKRINSEDPNSLSDMFAEGHNKIELEQESQMSNQELEQVVITLQKLVETVQSSTENLIPGKTTGEKSAARSAILDSNVWQILHSVAQLSIGFSTLPSTAQDPHTEGSNNVEVSWGRKKMDSEDVNTGESVKIDHLLNILSEGEYEARQLSLRSNEEHQTALVHLQSRFSHAIFIASSMKEAAGMRQMQSHSHKTASGLLGWSGSGSSKSDTSELTSRKRKNTVKRTVKVPCTTPNNGPSDAALPPDDGYIWRKYGQKNILNSKNPRSYYCCKYQRSENCLARKQVQRSDEDPTVFDVTYQGEHTCIQHFDQIRLTRSVERPLLIPTKNESSKYSPSSTSIRRPFSSGSLFSGSSFSEFGSDFESLWGSHGSEIETSNVMLMPHSGTSSIHDFTPEQPSSPINKQGGHEEGTDTPYGL